MYLDSEGHVHYTIVPKRHLDPGDYRDIWIRSPANEALMITNQFCRQLTLWTSVALFIWTISKWRMQSSLQVVKASLHLRRLTNYERGTAHHWHHHLDAVILVDVTLT